MVRTQRNIDHTLLSIIGISFASILALLPIHAFISTWGGTAIGPLLVWKSWKEILIVVLVPVVVWLCVIRPDIRQAMWRSWLNRIIAVYVLLTIVMAVISPASSGAVIAGLLMNLRFLAMFTLGELLLIAHPPWLGKFKNLIASWLIVTGIVLSLLAILQVTVIPKTFLSHFGYNKDTTIAPYLLVDEDPNALRAFATMRGPNTLASYLLLPLGLSLVLWWESRKKWWMLCGSGLMTLALFLTGSRSGWLGAAVMFAVLAYTTLPGEKLRTWIKFGTIPLAIVIAGVLWLATTVPALRLAVFHSGGNGKVESLTAGSSDKHWQATLRGLQTVVKNPLGQGVGTAGPASFYNSASTPNIPEDYYVQIGQEIGIAGLILFFAICIGIAKRLPQKSAMSRALLASFVGIGIINLFLHGWADDPTAMTWWGIAGLFVALPKQK